MKKNKENKISKWELWTFAIAIIYLLFYMLDIFVGSAIGYSLFYPQGIQISEPYICEGPDENGNPKNIRDSFDNDEVDEIFVCFFIESNHPGVLRVSWYKNWAEAPDIFIDGPYQFVFTERYVYFSLLESGKRASELLDLEEELAENYLPTGRYSVRIKQGWRELFRLPFNINYEK